MYCKSWASRANASVTLRVVSVAVDKGRLSRRGLLKHQEMSSSPQKWPGPRRHSLVLLLWRRRYELSIVPRTMKSICLTGSPSFKTCELKARCEEFSVQRSTWRTRSRQRWRLMSRRRPSGRCRIVAVSSIPRVAAQIWRSY